MMILTHQPSINLIGLVPSLPESFPKLADIPTTASKEMSETETTSDTPFQENLANEANLSNFVPRVYNISTQLCDNGWGSHTSPPNFLHPSCLSPQAQGLHCLCPHHHPYHLILFSHHSPIFLTPSAYCSGLTCYT